MTTITHALMKRREIDDALASAAGSSDQDLMARLFAYRSVSEFYFLQIRASLEHSRKAIELNEIDGNSRTHSIALTHAMLAHYYRGEVADAKRIAIELEPVARKLGHLAAISHSVSVQAWTEFARGADIENLDRRFTDDLSLNRSARVPLFLAPSLAQMSLAKLFAGDLDLARSLAIEARETELPGIFDGLSDAMLIRLEVYSGDQQAASQALHQARRRLPQLNRPNTIGAWSLLIATIESLAMRGERDQALELYPLALELIACGAIYVSVAGRFAQTIAGIAAGAAGQWLSAETHFLTALRQAEQFPHRLEQAEIRRFHAAMLLERDATGDRARAKEMLVNALDFYKDLGMPRHGQITLALLEAAERGGPDSID